MTSAERSVKVMGSGFGQVRWWVSQVREGSSELIGLCETIEKTIEKEKIFIGQRRESLVYNFLQAPQSY